MRLLSCAILAFTLNVSEQFSNFNAPTRPIKIKLFSSTDDDLARLQESARRLREEAANLEVSLGKKPTKKSIETSSTSHYIAPRWSSSSHEGLKRGEMPLEDPKGQKGWLEKKTDVFGSIPRNKLQPFEMPVSQVGKTFISVFGGILHAHRPQSCSLQFQIRTKN